MQAEVFIVDPHQCIFFPFYLRENRGELELILLKYAPLHCCI